MSRRINLSTYLNSDALQEMKNEKDAELLEQHKNADYEYSEYPGLKKHRDITRPCNVLTRDGTLETVVGLGNFENRLLTLWERDGDPSLLEDSAKHLSVKVATHKKLRRMLLSATLVKKATANSDLKLFNDLCELGGREYKSFNRMRSTKSDAGKIDWLNSMTPLHLAALSDFLKGISASGYFDCSKEQARYAGDMSKTLHDILDTDQPQCKAARYMERQDLEMDEPSSGMTAYTKNIRGRYFDKLGYAIRVFSNIRGKDGMPDELQAQYKAFADYLFLNGIDLEEMMREYKITDRDVDAFAMQLYRYDPSFGELVNEKNMIVPLVVLSVLASELKAFKEDRTKELITQLGGERVQKAKSGRNTSKKKLSRREKATARKTETDYSGKIADLEEAGIKLALENEKLKGEYRNGIEQENIRLAKKLENARDEVRNFKDASEKLREENRELNLMLEQMQKKLDEYEGDTVEDVCDERSFTLMTVSAEYGAGMKRFFPNMSYTTKPVIPAGPKKPVVVTMGLTNHKTTQYLTAGGFQWYPLWTKHKGRAAVEIRDFLDSLEEGFDE